MSRQLVLYHGNCPDGFAAAWACWRKFGSNAEYVPVLYGQKDFPAGVDGADVLLVDFSYPRPMLGALRARAARLTVLDHHKTAAEDLAGFPDAIFDMNRSGATLAWDWLHGDRAPRPALVDYAEDRDLWRFRLPDSREISMVVWSYPREFEVYNDLAARLSAPGTYWQLVAEGRAILRYQQQLVTQMCEQARWQEIRGHRVPVVNASVCLSEVGERLCELHPEAPFGACYFDRADGVQQWGARSRTGFDVSAVAKVLGGGGHPGAAGWQIDPPKNLKG